MGRKLQFDKNQAMVMAMEHFWSLGYDSTSMRDIADNIGIHLGSVYNALGDKEMVFEKALKLNFDTHVLPALDKLCNADHPMGALNDFMDRVVDECSGVEPAPGCFLINSILEIAAINDTVTTTLHDYLTKIEEGFATCISRAVGAGQLPIDTDARKKARFIIATLFSLRVMGKLKMPHHYIRSIKESAMMAVQAA